MARYDMGRKTYQLAPKSVDSEAVTAIETVNCRKSVRGISLLMRSKKSAGMQKRNGTQRKGSKKQCDD